MKSGTLEEGQVIEGDRTSPGLTRDILPPSTVVPIKNTSNTLAQLQSDLKEQTAEESKENKIESEENEDSNEEEN